MVSGAVAGVVGRSRWVEVGEGSLEEAIEFSDAAAVVAEVRPHISAGTDCRVPPDVLAAYSIIDICDMSFFITTQFVQKVFTHLLFSFFFFYDVFFSPLTSK